MAILIVIVMCHFTYFLQSVYLHYTLLLFIKQITVNRVLILHAAFLQIESRAPKTCRDLANLLDNVSSHLIGCPQLYILFEVAHQGSAGIAFCPPISPLA